MVISSRIISNISASRCLCHNREVTLKILQVRFLLSVISWESYWKGRNILTKRSVSKKKMKDLSICNLTPPSHTHTGNK